MLSKREDQNTYKLLTDYHGNLQLNKGNQEKMY